MDRWQGNCYLITEFGTLEKQAVSLFETNYFEESSKKSCLTVHAIKISLYLCQIIDKGAAKKRHKSVG